MGFSSIIAIAPLLLAAAEAADSLVFGGGPSATGAHIGDALTVAYSAPNNEVVTIGLVQGPMTNLVIVQTVFVGTGSSFTFTPTSTLTPGTYALGIYDAKTYNFWPPFNLAAATTATSVSTSMTTSATSTSAPASVQPQSIPPTTSSMTSMTSMPTMTTSLGTPSSSVATTTMSMSSIPVVAAPLFQNTTLTTTVCDCHHSSTAVPVPGTSAAVSSMSWSGNSSYTPTWNPTGAMATSTGPVSPSISLYQGNSGTVNSASGVVSALGAIVVALWMF